MKHMQKRKSVHFSAPAWLWLCFCIGAAVIFSGVLLCSWSSRTRAEISQGVLRLHILANSDTDMDQQLKLQVRDAVLAAIPEAVTRADTPQQAAAALQTALPALQNAADNALHRAHSAQTARLRLERFAFAARDYGGFALPGCGKLHLQHLVRAHPRLRQGGTVDLRQLRFRFLPSS